SRVTGGATWWADGPGGDHVVRVESGPSWHVVPDESSLRVEVGPCRIACTGATVATMTEGRAVIVVVVAGRVRLTSPIADVWLEERQAAVVGEGGHVTE